MTAAAQPDRTPLASARRVVVKLGTRVVARGDGSLALARLFTAVEAVAELMRQGREVLLVSSGAVGLGSARLGYERPPQALAERQACAAVGQSLLMELYQQGFGKLGLTVGQVLLTEGDFDDRARYLNLRATLSELVQRGVLPIINENDTVSTAELAFVDGPGRPVFGDNDRLSALVAAKLGADALILLTDVAGVYERDPRVDPDAPLLHRIDDARSLMGGLSGAGSAYGRGGMRSKVEAALVAVRSGVEVVIASGHDPGAVPRILAGERIGSWFPAGDGLTGRRRWIAFATAPRGTLRIDAGAVRALRERGASLLAIGVSAIEGEFESGDVVELRGPDGGLVGRGAVGVDATRARAWAAGERPDAARNRHALVHRDQLVLEETE